MLQRLCFVNCLLLTIVIALPTVLAIEADQRTPLDEYVAKPDPAFAWQVVDRRQLPTHSEIIVSLTSQTWRSPDEVNRIEWQHELAIIVPKQLRSDVALLFISGGSNRDEPPRPAAEELSQVALATETVVVELRHVPNQPLQVLASGEPDRKRVEDDLLAASWNRYKATKDPTWIAQLPMAKSAVAAMDAVQQALAKESQPIDVKSFVVAGGSKRGWTTWLTAAVDRRVKAIAPIVIDVLNIGPSMRHHHATYGFWSEALEDYQREGLTKSIDSDENTAIHAIVDPYVYRQRYTMPKCIINASGDEFFLPDSSRFYYDELVGEKHLSYTPNAGHSLEGSNALDTLIAFHASVAHNLTRPTVTWTLSNGGSEFVVRCSAKPLEATLWRAENSEARDFRHPIIGDAYAATQLHPDADGQYQVTLKSPEAGFAATFARFAFDIGAARPFRISTPVWVTPDVEPFAELNSP